MSRKVKIIGALVLGLLVALQAADAVQITTSFSPSVQGGTLFNSRSVSAVDSPVSVTIAFVANAQAHLYAVDGFCSAGTAQLQVTLAGVLVWETPAGAVGTTSTRVTWPVGLTGAQNQAMVITLTTCGAANTGTLMVQADRF